MAGCGCRVESQHEANHRALIASLQQLPVGSPGGTGLSMAGCEPPTIILYCATHGAAERLADALDEVLTTSRPWNREGAATGQRAAALLKEIGR